MVRKPLSHGGTADIPAPSCAACRGAEAKKIALQCKGGFVGPPVVVGETHSLKNCENQDLGIREVVAGQQQPAGAAGWLSPPVTSTRVARQAADTTPRWAHRAALPRGCQNFVHDGTAAVWSSEGQKFCCRGLQPSETHWCGQGDSRVQRVLWMLSPC